MKRRDWMFLVIGGAVVWVYELMRRDYEEHAAGYPREP